MAVRPAARADERRIAGLLQEAGLPAVPLAHGSYWVHEDDTGTVDGCIGLVRYGLSALLRSLAVGEPGRGRGHGQALMRHAIAAAAADGVRQLVGFTETATQFCQRFGFDPIARDRVPPEVQASDQFQGTCPVTAQALLLDLTRPPMWIRRAVAADAAVIARIKNQGIEERIATLDTDLLDEEAMRAWLQDHGQRLPVTVMEDAGGILGFASLNRFNARQAYRFVADMSVYVEHSARRRGVGRRLVQDLLPRARQIGYHKVVLSMFPTNVAAHGLYVDLGFRTVGIYREQGLLDGQWVDTEIMECLL